MLREQSSCLIVFICTGNTCRSPLAEALCKKRLSDRLGCGVEELPGHGFSVVSAGLAASMGGSGQRNPGGGGGLRRDLARHCSRP